MQKNLMELQARFDARKSFYGKALVEESNGEHTLYSYNTPILKVGKNGVMQALWDGWSQTTGRHIKEFTRQYTGQAMDKKGYIELTKDLEY